MKWYYVEGGKSVGPLEEPHLHVLVRGGQLDPRTMVYSQRLSGWTPYLQAFGQPSVAGGNTAGAQTRSLGNRQPGQSGNPSPGKEVIGGLAVAAGIILALAVLLTIHGMQTWGGLGVQDGRTDTEKPGGDNLATLQKNPSRAIQTSTNDADSATSQPVWSDYNGPRAQAVRPQRNLSSGNKNPDSISAAQEAAFRRRYGITRTNSPAETPPTMGPRATMRSPAARATGSSLLALALDKNDVQRVLTGKTMREIQALLGSPDETSSVQVEWRYRRGVCIYEPESDSTFLSVQLEFAKTVRAGGPGLQLEYTVRKVTLLPVPSPKPGRLKL
jgi:hypothetical protein